MKRFASFSFHNYFSVFFILIFLLSSNLFSFNPATHMYIGRHTFDVWKDFDPSFYNLISNTYSSGKRLKCRKFYYIGLTLPDLFLEKGQKHSEELIEILYDIRDNIEYNSPFYIYDETRSLVQTRIKFPDPGDPEPNKNLERLYQMACYARGCQGSTLFPTPGSVLFPTFSGLNYKSYAAICQL